jgi:hypothetical protein
VKATDWRDLCNREHEQGGEVIAVSLTVQSMRELVNDVLASASATMTLDPDESGRLPVVAGARLGSLTNEATGREVDFTPLAEADTATVRDADGSVRVIAFAAA